MQQYFICVCFALITINQLVSAVQIEVFRQQALSKHNEYRREQCAGPLQLNSTLDDLAQAHCEQMASTGNFTHSGRTDYGETSYQKIPSESTDNGSKFSLFNRLTVFYF